MFKMSYPNTSGNGVLLIWRKCGHQCGKLHKELQRWLNGYKHLLFQKTGISFPAPLSVDSVPAAGNLTPFLAPWTPTLDIQIDAYACNENNNWVRAPVTGTICWVILLYALRFKSFAFISPGSPLPLWRGNKVEITAGTALIFVVLSLW